VRRAARDDLILAVSERLNLEKAGVALRDLPARVVWFKDRIQPKAVLDVLESETQPVAAAGRHAERQ
jgi:predicted nuclease of restriction endonuclease-like RecB superfamily